MLLPCRGQTRGDGSAVAAALPKKIFLLAIALLLALTATAVGFPTWFPKIWGHFLVINTPHEPVDAIILLGGEPQARPLEAARLFREGLAPRVLVIGTGDNDWNRRLLIKNGVPADRIATEKSSTSTFENAEFTRPILAAQGVKTAMLVTSSFHARRALATFQQRIPEVRFGIATSRIGWWDTPQGRPQENRWAMIEIAKLTGYWIFHGITPWVSTGPAAARDNS
jgi:uncharacterized SAM-binding protein YcdF (DUF218 family)